MTNALIEVLKPIQDDFASSPEWQEATNKAYPPPGVKKKEKKAKDKGSRHPGGGKASAGASDAEAALAGLQIETTAPP